MEDQKIFSLSTILNRVQSVFDNYMSGKNFWIRVEISKLNIDRKGHLYLELVESREGQTLAKCRATIWKRNANLIMEELGDSAMQVLKEGAEILCYCDVVFSPVFGFSINISQIDVAFSLGEVERKKRETLQQLQKLGLLEKNAQLNLPRVLQRIALIGSVGTSGHEDFVNQLHKNEYGFAYAVQFFDTRVQGLDAAKDITNCLKNLPHTAFDVVVILRGGGSKFDLEVFNDFGLAVEIANCPLPVFTGIGHETDSTVADFVAHTYFKTPSAVAAFIVEKTVQYYAEVLTLYKEIRTVYEQKMTRLNHQLDIVSREIKSEVVLKMRKEKNNLQIVSNQLVHDSKRMLSGGKESLKLKQQIVELKPKMVVQKANNKLKEQAQVIALLSSGVLQQKQSVLQLKAKMLKHRSREVIKKEQIKLDSLSSISALLNVENLLKKGLAVVAVDGVYIDDQTNIMTGSTIEIQTAHKIYQIVVSNSKEINRWNNLLTKMPQ
ncbi:MAG: exodeoxyribonuclease VII large subunit [Flavobacteriaceae bacterium]|jgi:exodeoxyribonuclease VII large subunit|nr:exodeoxyribonuclease VII large subunit [Flavobacteriaceae bacterium]